jgi:hypothetical protein
MPADNKRTGQQGEEIAAGFLTARGYRILERNFRYKGVRWTSSPAIPVTKNPSQAPFFRHGVRRQE